MATARNSAAAKPAAAKPQGPSQAVQKAQTREVATAADNTVPDYIKRGSGRGSEDVEMSDVVIPRIELVQALSPCLDKKKPEFIEGAEQGMMFNSVTRELYGEEVLVVPVLFKKEWLVWKDRNQGGGFRGAHPSMTEAQARIEQEPADQRKFFTANETAQQLVKVLHEDGRIEDAVVSMSRTKLKVSKQWNSLIRINGNDRFSRTYRLFGADDSNDKGEYKNFGVMNAGFPPEDVYKEAEALYNAISSGARKAVFDHDEGGEEDTSGGSGEY